MEFRKRSKRFIRHLLSVPVIYIMILPIIILDLFLEIYHRICFLLYKLPYVKRSTYIKIDRQKLSYLNWLEKLNCMYCSYANGLFHYASIIAAATETYWCGIQHEKMKGFIPPKHHKDFLPYNDEEAFQRFIKRTKKD